MKLLLLLLLLAAPAFAQETDGPKPDRWRGMIIDQSTPDDAIKALGKPKSDKLDRIKIRCIDSRSVSKRQELKIYRVLKFPDTPEMSEIEMAFFEEKLILIQIQPKKDVPAASLSTNYSLQFQPWYRTITQLFSPGRLERDNGTVYAKRFPSAYGLVARTEQAYIGAIISNMGFKSVMFGVPGDAAFPGRVYLLQIISLSLENRDGADVLK